MAPLFKLTVNLDELRVVINRASLNLNAAQMGQLAEGLRDAAANVQRHAVDNVSGAPVRYQGRVFRVSVRTGALRSSIQMQWPYQDWMTARVYVNGSFTLPDQHQFPGQLSKPRPVSEYAASIEYGHGVIDLKRTMMGKTVPFFAAMDSNATGPYAFRGLKPVADDHFDQFGKPLHWTPKTNERTAGGLQHPPMVFTKKGVPTSRHGHGTYFIAFRRVGKEGWVIPAAKPRPFMRAALSNTRNQTRDILNQALANMVTGKHHRGQGRMHPWR